jgi:hypothetical protein
MVTRVNNTKQFIYRNVWSIWLHKYIKRQIPIIYNPLIEYRIYNHLVNICLRKRGYLI